MFHHFINLFFLPSNTLLILCESVTVVVILNNELSGYFVQGN